MTVLQRLLTAPRANAGLGRAGVRTRSSAVWPLVLVLALLAGSVAFAAGNGQPGGAAGDAGHPSEVVFIIQILLLLVFGRLLGEALTRVGQPAIMGQLIAGIVLGPTVFGSLWPDAQHAIFSNKPEQKAMIDAISQFGILMLLLLTGMETDLKLVRKVGRAAIGVSIAGVAVPFVCGFAAGQYIPESILGSADNRTLTSLFLGTALSISSVKIVAIIVREMDFMRRNLGQIIVAAAIMEDSIGWIIVAIIFGLAQSGTIDAWSVGRALIGTMAFMAISLTFGRRIVTVVIRWTNDNFESEVPVITAILAIMCVMALITNAIGVHTVLGAFVAGILIGESPILTEHIESELRGLITAFFMPIFFGTAGLSADLTILADPRLLALTALLIAIASIGKFTGAFIGGRVGGLNYRECYALASGMNARGSTEVVIATVGLSMGALTHDLFTMIVTMAIVTTLAMPPMLRSALRRLPPTRAEKQRLEREEFEAKGFVANLERLLLAVDDSANGKFASRVGGLLAGTRGMPITIVPIGTEGAARGKANEKDAAETGRGKKADTKKADAKTADTKKSDAKKSDAKKSETTSGKADPKTGAKTDVKKLTRAAARKSDKADSKSQELENAETTEKESKIKISDAEATVRASAEKSKPMNPDAEKRDVAKVEVLTKAEDISPEDQIAEEFKKGYDMLFVGMENSRRRSGFHDDLARIVEEFDGPFAVALTRGVHEKKPTDGQLNILVPVTGTDVSRRAAEVAIALSRALGDPVTGLYVSAGKRTGKRNMRRRLGRRRQEEAILKDFSHIADQYKARATTAIRTDVEAPQAIMREAAKGDYNLIVLGVSRRPGDHLFFGDTAAMVIEGAKQTILLVST